MTLMRERMAPWNCLSTGRMAGCRVPSMRYFTCTRVVEGLDVDVARTALQGGVDRRVDEPDDGADVAREPLDGQALLAALVLVQNLQLEALGRLVEDPLRPLALLEDGLDGRRGPDRHPDGGVQQQGQLVDLRQIDGVRDDDDEGVVHLSIGDEAVPEHEVGGNGPEQVGVDAEPIHVRELHAVAFGEPAGPRDLLGAVDRRRGAVAPRIVGVDRAGRGTALRAGRGGGIGAGRHAPAVRPAIVRMDRPRPGGALPAGRGGGIGAGRHGPAVRPAIVRMDRPRPGGTLRAGRGGGIGSTS